MEISLPLGRSMMTGSQFEMPHVRQDIKPIFASLSTSAAKGTNSAAAGLREPVLDF